MLRRAVLGLFTLSLLAGCGGASGDDGAELEGGVPIKVSYDVVVDESRTVTVAVDVTFRPYASVKDADAGESDTFVEAKGTVSYTNKSNDRAIGKGDAKHELSYMIPYDACVLSPVYVSVIEDYDLVPDDTASLYCGQDIETLASPALEPGETVVKDLDVRRDGTSVAEEDADVRVEAEKAAVIVAGADERFAIANNGLNPTCTYGADKTARAVLYTSDPEVTPCSAEVGPGVEKRDE